MVIFGHILRFMIVYAYLKGIYEYNWPEWPSTYQNGGSINCDTPQRGQARKVRIQMDCMADELICLRLRGVGSERACQWEWADWRASMFGW